MSSPADTDASTSHGWFEISPHRTLATNITDANTRVALSVRGHSTSKASTTQPSTNVLPTADPVRPFKMLKTVRVASIDDANSSWFMALRATFTSDSVRYALGCSTRAVDMRRLCLDQ